MSRFWSGWVMFLVVLNLGITLFLFVWSQRLKIPTRSDGTTGHVWAHGVLREGVRRLPMWWVIFSAGMFVFPFGPMLAIRPSRMMTVWSRRTVSRSIGITCTPTNAVVDPV